MVHQRNLQVCRRDSVLASAPASAFDSACSSFRHWYAALWITYMVPTWLSDFFLATGGNEIAKGKGKSISAKGGKSDPQLVPTPLDLSHQALGQMDIGFRGFGAVPASTHNHALTSWEPLIRTFIKAGHSQGVGNMGTAAVNHRRALPSFSFRLRWPSLTLRHTL